MAFMSNCTRFTSKCVLLRTLGTAIGHTGQQNVPESYIKRIKIIQSMSFCVNRNG